VLVPDPVLGPLRDVERGAVLRFEGGVDAQVEQRPHSVYRTHPGRQVQRRVTITAQQQSAL